MAKLSLDNKVLVWLGILAAIVAIIAAFIPLVFGDLFTRSPDPSSLSTLAAPTAHNDPENEQPSVSPAPPPSMSQAEAAEQSPPPSIPTQRVPATTVAPPPENDTPPRGAGPANNANPPVSTPDSAPPSNANPAARTVTIYNQVTNGSSQMREANTPAFLSNVTRNYCRRDGCVMDGTDMPTGVMIKAVCQIRGDLTTNGQNDSSIDDRNPGLHTSNLWYGIRWPDRRLGFISEVWINAGERGGLGLPGC